MAPQVPRSLDDRASLFVVMLVVLIGDTARGIMFPTLWPYVKSMGGNRIMQGYCVGAFSLGRVLISPILGDWSVKKGYKEVLCFSSVVLLTGVLGYALSTATWHLVYAQVVIGMGSGSLGVTRAYVADKSTAEQRTYLLAYVTAVQYAGFTVMPFAGAFLSHLLLDNEYPLAGPFKLNQFTAPAYIMAGAAVINFCLLKTIFQDSTPLPKKKKDKRNSPPPPLLLGDGTTAGEGLDKVYPSSSSALVASNASLSSKGFGSMLSTIPSSLNCSETSTSPATATSSSVGDMWPPKELKDEEEGWSRSEATIFLNGGGDSTLQERSLSKSYGRDSAERLVEPQPCPCLRPPSEMDLLIFGGFLLNMSTKGTIACFETLGAEYSMNHFGLTSSEAGVVFATFGAMGVVALLSIRVLCKLFNDVQIVLGGLVMMIGSCILFLPSPSGMNQLPLFLWAVFLMYAVGYPIGHTAVLGLFSKVVGKQPQGALLGWFGSAGSVARITFPIIAGVVSERLGTSTLFLFMVIILSTTFAILFIFRQPYLTSVENSS
ncbi:unnamed protein product [Discosporangium mesarthrocarpum]